MHKRLRQSPQLIGVGSWILATVVVAGLLAAAAGALWSPLAPALLASWSASRQPGAGCTQTHIVTRGESLSQIAANNRLTIQELAASNGLEANAILYLGQTLCIPSAGGPTPIPTLSPTLSPTVTSTVSLTVTAAPPSAIYMPSPVILWNEVMLAAIRSGSPRPPVVTRTLFMVHAAMYDAWAAYDESATPYALDPALRRPKAEHTLDNKAAAIHQAAYQMLVNLYPAYEANTLAFSGLLVSHGHIPLSGEPDPTTPEAIGYLAAQAVLAARAADGANPAGNYADVTSPTYPELYAPANAADPAAPNAPGNPEFDPNRWTPLRVPTGARTDENGRPVVDNGDPATYNDQTFLTPHWGAVLPFALTRGDQFRPPPPPQLGSTAPYTDSLGNVTTGDQAFIRQTDELLAMSRDFTDEEKVVAEYWIDGPRSETPPGHWNALAHGIAERDHHTLDEDVKLFFALNGALLDAGISAWDAKRAYDFVRPITAIRTRYAGQTVEAWGGYGVGTVEMQGGDWLPYQDPTFVTPPFAEYVSGHSTFSAAAAAVLTAFTGSEQFYDGVTVLYYEDYNRDGVPDMLGQHVAVVDSLKLDKGPAQVTLLRWPTFQDAANEAGISRRFGGIHFQDADLFGRVMGEQIGAQAFALAARYWTGDAP